MLVSNGKEIDRVTGLTTEQQLRGMLNRLPKPAPAVAQGKGEPRNGKGSSSGDLGLPVDIGQMDQPDGKQPKGPGRGIADLFGGSNKEKKHWLEKGHPGEQPDFRGQTPHDVAVDSVDPLQASVRLRVQDGTGINFGSGTIIDSKPGRMVILTCGHIFRKGGNESKVEVDVFGPNAKSRPETVQGKVLHFDLEADVGVVTIAYAQRLPVVRLGSSRELVVKDRVLGIGCGGGDKPTREDLTLTALNKYDGPDNIECTGMPQQGRSGGGLFLGSELIGVCIAADPREQRGIFAGMKPIAQLLDKVGMGHLAPLPPTTEGALAATNAVGTKTADLRDPALPDRGAATAADDISRFLGGELGAAALAGPPGAPQDYEGAEIICIVRPKTPGAPSRVVIVNQASHRFVGDLLHESQAPAERATARSDTALPPADRRVQPFVGNVPSSSATARVANSNPRPAAPSGSRPIETSFEPQPYRRQRDK
ncbi:MAG: trypsin-like peptidase domain-containing protein [Candidatus Saccharimonas sp.]|nr:trypsin-like peptidase domain-containing protein [Planctomycetaceae bacterium]